MGSRRLTNSELLAALRREALEDLAQTSDEELQQEARADGEDPVAVANRVRVMLLEQCSSPDE